MAKNNQALTKNISMIFAGLVAVIFSLLVFNSLSSAVENPQNGGVGVEGKISSPPPKNAPTISSPRSGQSFTSLPITVTGICSGDVLIKLFKNNVFSGSAECKNNNFSITTDLFTGINELVVRGYDALDQASPDSNLVSLTYSDNNAANFAARLALTTNYTRRGANPNELITWPILISGGVGPYAISVDWGDGTSADIYSTQIPGEFTVKHTYEQSGVYRALVKATDKNGMVAYLQLTAVSNGEIKGSTVAGADSTANNAKTIVLWQPVMIAIPLIITTFWIGKRYELLRIKKKFMKGEDPF